MKDYPVIKFTFPFICGIIFNHLQILPLIFYLILLPALAFSFYIFFRTRLRSHLAVTILIYISAVFSGAFAAKLNSGQGTYISPNVYAAKKITVFGQIEKLNLLHHGFDMPIDNRRKTITFNLKADSIIGGETKINKEFMLICNVHDESEKSLDSLYYLLKPGYYISISGSYYKGREKRNPGEFNYDNYLRSKGISGIFTAFKVNDVLIYKDDIHLFENFLFTIRKGIHEKIIKYHTPLTASLLKGLLLNDRSEMDFETKNEFINSGVIHVLAVSGLHVGYIVLVFLIIFGRFNIYSRSVLTAAGLILFMLITGSPASVVRATLMAVIILLAFLSGRSTNLFNSLGLSALIILIIKPDDLFDPGFQLSYAAVLSMAAIYPTFSRMITNLNIGVITRNILLFMTLSLSAQIGTIPFTLYYFGKLSLTSLAANLVVIPSIGIIVGISIFTIVITVILPAAASVYASANDALTFITLKFIELTGNPGFSFLRIRNFSGVDSAAYYFILFLFFYWIEKFSGWKSKLLLTLLVLLNLIFLPSLDDKELLRANELNLVMIDVGQGDAFLLKFPNGKTALVDAGEKTFTFDNGERVVLPLLDHLGISKIDYAFLSHLDSDHCGGFKSLIKQKMIGCLYKPLADPDDIEEVNFELFLEKYNIPFRNYKRERIQIGNTNIYILNEPENLAYRPQTRNDKSGILKIVYGRTSFLFTGDAEGKTEEFLLSENGSFLKSDVLKISHHGSNTSSGKNFISAVDPGIALISSGIGNKFNHPSARVLERLDESGIKILRTDIDAGILLRSDGVSISEISWKNF